MDILLQVGIFITALTVLLKGSDWFVDSAEEIGLALGIPPFIIGVTIIAFGTSLPELATSIIAVLENNSEIVIGNVVGSNITNIALVLGLVAIYAKEIRLDYNIWHIDMPFLWGSAFILYFVVHDQQVTLLETIVLLIGLTIFLLYSLGGEKNKENNEKEKIKPRSWLFLLIGGLCVWLGADYTISSIQNISVSFGVNKEIIALSAVALGTSLPEVIVSLSAARKGKTGIAVGNVLGSNIFNTYIVMGIPSLIGPLTIPSSINEFYLPMMVAMTILFGIMANNKKITRWEGAVLLMFYILFAGAIITGA